MTKLPSISIVVPAKNEEEALPRLCESIAAAMGKHEYEIVLVNDHSTDDTAKAAKKLGKKYPIRVHTLDETTGKAAGVLAGVDQAKYDVAAFIDADLQYSPSALPEMLELIGRDQADVVTGNRTIQAGSYMPSPYARVRNWLYRRLLGLDCDVQSGLKVFKKQYMQGLKMHLSNSWSLDSQFLYRARRMGARIGGVSISYDARIEGETKNGRRRLNAFTQIYEVIYLWFGVNILRWS